MIDINLIRKQPDLVRDSLKRRGQDAPPWTKSSPRTKSAARHLLSLKLFAISAT
jgi:seryl-tRNA synthetase